MKKKENRLHALEALNTRWCDLLISSQKGEQEAYRLFLGELAKKMERIVTPKFQDHSRAEDVVQEILLGVHKALATFDSSSSACSWVYAIARHKINDSLRVIYREDKRFMGGEVDFNLVDFICLVDEGFLQFEAQETLQELFEELNEEQRTVLRLTKLEGLSVDETAAQMGLSVSNVKVLTHRAMKQLKGLVNAPPHEGAQS